jgi:phage terminase large subunit-like protein
MAARRPARRGSSPDLPPCGRTLDGAACAEVGDHFCVPRADHVCKFFEELLVHTKGKHYRHRFLLRDWQREILRPLFGQVVWSLEHEAYVRQYRIAYIEMARKNGKSQILAGIMLYLLFADGEYSAEIYGVAKDREQASAVFNVASQMVLLEPLLSQQAKPISSTKRIVRASTNGVYAVKAADAGRILGLNPSGVAADEILAWPKREVWDAFRSGMGSSDRMQPLMAAATTAPADDESFGADMHREMVRVAEDPSRAPHVFTWIKNLPLDADIYDERNWHIPNPALGDFLSLEEMRRMAVEARNDPVAELSFRRFQLNQTLSSEVHWMPMHLWDACAGTYHGDSEATMNAFAGRECWMGVDLAGRLDLTSICYLFGSDDGESADAVWRHWMPREAYERLNRANDGKLAEYAADGWLEITEGNILDFHAVYEAIEADSRRFTILGIDADRWSMDPVLQEIGERVYVNPDEIMAYNNDFNHMSGSMHRLFELVKEQRFRHHGNPLARWCFDCCEARLHTSDPDLIMPAKVKRDLSNNRIDAVPAAIMALKAWWERGREVYSVYQNDDLLVL